METTNLLGEALSGGISAAPLGALMVGILLALIILIKVGSLVVRLVFLALVLAVLAAAAGLFFLRH